MVRVGSARSNENGGINGGKPGDQKNGREVSTQDWYLHSKGWVVIRAKDRPVRELIAHNMESICANNNIGYCQEHRTSLTAIAAGYGYDASKVLSPCETDCSEAVRVCCLYAGVKVASFNTANEVSTLWATGKFDILKDDKYCKKPDYLSRGDILVTRTKGHTVVVLDDGAKAAPLEPEKKSGWIQEAGIWRYYHGDTGEPVRNDWHRDPDGRWYWFDGSGVMVANAWKQDRVGKWYYLGSDGAMVTGRLMQIGDEVFAFGQDGAMLRGEIRCRCNERGALTIV